MDNHREYAVQKICDYITSRIKRNLRVDIEVTEKTASQMIDVSMTKELEGVLNKAVKLIPDVVIITERVGV